MIYYTKTIGGKHMNQDEKIISMLEGIKGRLDSIDTRLDTMDKRFYKPSDSNTEQVEILRDEIWENRVDIRRIKKTMAME